MIIEDGLNGATSTPEENPAATPPQENTATNPSAEPNPAAEATPDRVFTRDEVTTIVKRRTERAVNKILEKFGLDSKDKIEEYLTNHKQLETDLNDSKTKYGELEGKYNELDSKNKSLMREYLYLKNNIIPEKYGDVDKEFTEGLTEEKLLEVLKFHPEFVKPKVVIPQTIGQPQQGQQQGMTEKERAEKLFHVKL